MPLWSVIAGFFLLLMFAVPWVGAIIVVLAIVVGVWYVFRKRKEDRMRREALLWTGDIDIMNGVEFEKMLEIVFENLGYRAEHIGQRGDFGADLLLSKNGQKIVVQAKRYSSNVGNKAVQEVYSSMPHYGASEGWVVTNSFFTPAAAKQAQACNIRLVGREELIKAIVLARGSNQGKP